MEKAPQPAARAKHFGFSDHRQPEPPTGLGDVLLEFDPDMEAFLGNDKADAMPDKPIQTPKAYL